MRCDEIDQMGQAGCTEVGTANLLIYGLIFGWILLDCNPSMAVISQLLLIAFPTHTDICLNNHKTDYLILLIHVEGKKIS